MRPGDVLRTPEASERGDGEGEEGEEGVEVVRKSVFGGGLGVGPGGLGGMGGGGGRKVSGRGRGRGRGRVRGKRALCTPLGMLEELDIKPFISQRRQERQRDGQVILGISISAKSVVSPLSRA